MKNVNRIFNKKWQWNCVGDKSLSPIRISITIFLRKHPWVENSFFINTSFLYRIYRYLVTVEKYQYNYTLESQRSRPCRQKVSCTAWSSSSRERQNTRRWLQSSCEDTQTPLSARMSDSSWLLHRRVDSPPWTRHTSSANTTLSAGTFRTFCRQNSCACRVAPGLPNHHHLTRHCNQEVIIVPISADAWYWWELHPPSTWGQPDLCRACTRSLASALQDLLTARGSTTLSSANVQAAAVEPQQLRKK